MEDHIRFSAKYKSWIVVKKMKIDEDTENIDVGRILLSIRETLDNKIYDYLGDYYDIPSLEKKVDELVPSGKLNEDQIANILKTLRSPKTTKMLKEFTEEKLKLEIYKQLYTELVLRRLKLNVLKLKNLDKFVDDKNRRL